MLPVNYWGELFEKGHVKLSRLAAMRLSWNVIGDDLMYQCTIHLLMELTQKYFRAGKLPKWELDRWLYWQGSHLWLFMSEDYQALQTIPWTFCIFSKPHPEIWCWLLFTVSHNQARQACYNGFSFWPNREVTVICHTRWPCASCKNCFAIYVGTWYHLIDSFFCINKTTSCGEARPLQLSSMTSEWNDE